MYHLILVVINRAEDIPQKCYFKGYEKDVLSVNGAKEKLKRGFLHRLLFQILKNFILFYKLMRAIQINTQRFSIALA